MKGAGMTSEILNKTPKGDQSERDSSFFEPQKKPKLVKYNFFLLFSISSYATLTETLAS